jgi:hypothetical protein
MRQWIRSRLTFANVVSLAALFVALGGTATAVTYVVSSNSQIGPNTVSGHTPPSGKHANVIPGSVNGQDVADNSLRGADINESLLGQVPSARLGGLGGDTGFEVNDCNPDSTAFITCVQTDTINLAAPTRVLVIGQVDGYPDQVGALGGGACHVGTNGGALTQSTAPIEVKDVGDMAAFSAVTGVVGPGPIKFGLDCDQTEGDIRYFDPHLSYVELSPASP